MRDLNESVLLYMSQICHNVLYMSQIALDSLNQDFINIYRKPKATSDLKEGYFHVKVKRDKQGHNNDLETSERSITLSLDRGLEKVPMFCRDINPNGPQAQGQR